MTSDPDNDWGAKVENFDPHTARTLRAIARDLFPHDHLGRQHYAVVVDRLDGLAGTDDTLRQLLIDGVKRLDAVHDTPWIELSESAREIALRSITMTKFFVSVRTAAIDGIYGSPLVYETFGYGGASKDLGGYIHRGFDDITWLLDD